MKMRRIVMAGVISSILLASCQRSESQQGTGSLRLSFAEPLESVRTRADYELDTNSFILSIKGNSGEVIYNGEYGSRPAEITVPSGTYELEVYSAIFEAPAFDSPTWGDSKVVVVSNGEQVAVQFLCKMTNSGVCFKLTDNFKEKFPAGKLRITQDGGSIDYSYSEQRIAYLKSGNTAFSYVASDGNLTELFNKVASAGEIYIITLDASKEESKSCFSMAIDTTVVRINEKVTIGEGHYGEDGSSAATAFSISSAASHMGDTVWVWGYIVGGDLSSSSISFAAPFAKSSNMAIASAASERTRDNCFSVELSKTAVKSALNLVDNPGNLGKKVTLKGVVSTYFGLTGIKSVSEYTIEQ